MTQAPVPSSRRRVAVHAGGDPGQNRRGSTAEKECLQQRAEVLREWVTPKSTTPLSTELWTGTAHTC